MKKICILILLMATWLAHASDDALQRQFNAAMSQLRESGYSSKLGALAQRHPDTLYGQKAWLELGKQALLKRDYDQAKSALKKTRQLYIPDKEYWLAKVYLQNQEYHLAITSAQNYIFSSNDADKIEISYFIITEGYMAQKLYHRAMEMLQTLRKSEYIINNIPLLHFKIGECYEAMGQYDNALASYRKLKQDFPYDQYTAQADDHIYGLKFDHKVSVDVSDLGTKQPKQNTIASGNYQVYLQAGAFGSSANARNLKKRIQNYNIPAITFDKKSGSKTLHVVAAGPFANDAAMKNAASKLKKNKIDTFVIKR
jgi:tetratricopeptide (TPR) repeat protein